MEILEVEDKIDKLSYIIDVLNTGMLYLETASLEDSRYSLYEAQLMEMCINLESEKESLIDDLSQIKECRN